MRTREVNLKPCRESRMFCNPKIKTFVSNHTERIRATIAKPSQKPQGRSSFSEARPNGENQSHNRRAPPETTRPFQFQGSTTQWRESVPQSPSGTDPPRRSRRPDAQKLQENTKRGLHFRSYYQFSSKRYTTMAESYHKGAEPNQTKVICPRKWQ